MSPVGAFTSETAGVFCQIPLCSLIFIKYNQKWRSGNLHASALAPASSARRETRPRPPSLAGVPKRPRRAQPAAGPNRPTRFPSGAGAGAGARAAARRSFPPAEVGEGESFRLTLSSPNPLLFAKLAGR